MAAPAPAREPLSRLKELATVMLKEALGADAGVDVDAGVLSHTSITQKAISIVCDSILEWKVNEETDAPQSVEEYAKFVAGCIEDVQKKANSLAEKYITDTFLAFSRLDDDKSSGENADVKVVDAKSELDEGLIEAAKAGAELLFKKIDALLGSKECTLDFVEWMFAEELND